MSAALSPAKLLAEAKNAAGDQAVAAAERKDYIASSVWTRIATEIDGLFRRSVEQMARG